MAFPIAWILNEIGQKMYAWSSTKAVMDFDRGGEKGQLLQETLKNLENNSISIYSCTTKDNTHNLVGTGNNIKFVADAPFNFGNTITINGQEVTAQSQNGTVLTTGAWLNGAIVTGWLNGKILTISSNPTYSEEETLTGKVWIDGKPIYRKAWVLETLEPGNYNVPKTIDIETPIAYGGVVKLSRGDLWPIPSPTVSGTTNFMISISTFNYRPENQFTVFIGDGFIGTTAITNLIVWVEYTKP